MKIRFIIAGLILVLLTTAGGFAEEGPMDPSIGGLTPLQVKVLRATGLPVLLPTYMPQGFQLERIIINISTKTRFGGGPSYKAIYRGGDTAFIIESASGGIGGVPGDVLKVVNSKLLGKVNLISSSQAGGMKKTDLISDWARYENHFFRLTGPGFYSETEKLQSISPVDAEQILIFLRQVKLQ